MGCPLVSPSIDLLAWWHFRRIGELNIEQIVDSDNLELEMETGQTDEHT
jgi:hypothetical protein